MVNSLNHTTTSNYSSINPLLAQRLELLKLDKSYYQAEGAYLYYQNTEKEEVRVVDFLGGYGAVLLGHHPPELVKAATQYLTNRQPVFAQLSIHNSTVHCAEWLQRELHHTTQQDCRVVFANTGAEAVEAALKHALLAYYNKVNAFFKKLDQVSAFIIHQIQKKEEARAVSIRVQLDSYRKRNEAIVIRNSPVILALQGAYHGKTIRAALTSWNPQYSLPFNPRNKHTHFIPPHEVAIKQAFEAHYYELRMPYLGIDGTLKQRTQPMSAIAAAIAEPIQGEGGICTLSTPFLEALSSRCKAAQVPFILDEIQTGCYRTGHFLYAPSRSIIADYYLLGKALGGGIAKISAVLIDKSKYEDQFGLMHSSTFAEDGWSSYVALKALSLAKASQANILNKSIQIRNKLKKLQHSYPDIITQVRGEGLMIGLAFKSFEESNSYAFQVMDQSGYLHYLYVSYLLHNWDIRLAATLSAQNVLRIQPPVCISDDDIEQLMQGLYALCEVLRCEDFYKLIEPILPLAHQGFRTEPIPFNHGNICREVPEVGAQKVGFITHFINAETVRECDPSLAILPNEAINRLLHQLLPVGAPLLLGSKNIRSANGKPVHITFAGLGLTSAIIKKELQSRQMDAIEALCEKAVKRLKKEQVSLIGLGQFTSIITANGLSLPETEIGLTTGNSFTAYTGISAVEDWLKKHNHPIHKTQIGIIGAGGNIASIIAEHFAQSGYQIILIGSPGARGHQKAVRTARNICQQALLQLQKNNGKPCNKLQEHLVQKGIFQYAQAQALNIEKPGFYSVLLQHFKHELPIQCLTPPDVLLDCDAVVVATNAATPFLAPEHFSTGTLVCDLSVPHNCTAALLNNSKGIEVIFGGIAELPNGEALPIKGFPLEKGQVYGCIGETLLLGLEGIHTSYSIGNIAHQQVLHLGEIAQQHGFKTMASKQCVLDELQT